MTSLPIRRFTLYKHGVGYFERRGKISGEIARLIFKRDEMNDVLKSLVAFDLGAGQVLNVAYEAPEDIESRLSSGSIHLSDDHSLLDLLRDLRGREVRLVLPGQTLKGRLVGVDVDDEQPAQRSLVSLLTGDGSVRIVPLPQVERVTLADEQAAADLAFFLDASLSEETQRAVTLRLTPGEHDLVVGYTAASPTWRVSYRFVGESREGENHRALLQGWGIFENRLDEDLEAVTVSLVAGMPISFIYNLYEPRIPERPVVEEEDRVVSGPFEAEAVLYSAPPSGGERMMAAMAPPAMAAPAPMTARSLRDELAEASPVQALGAALGETFKYDISVPITVRRGEAAMVPILSADLPYRKERLYNGQKLPDHPVLAARFQNDTGLTLERGPMTVVEDDVYVGEAMLDFTREGGEITVAYAVDLAVKVVEERSRRRELNALSIEKGLLVFHEFDISVTTYRVANSHPTEVEVILEHSRRQGYDPFDMPAADEMTSTERRWRVEVPPHEEVEFVVRERSLVRRREEIADQTPVSLQNYLRRNLLDQKLFDSLREILDLHGQRHQTEARLKAIEGERKAIYEAQAQIRGNLGTLKESGEEGKLRARYVKQLEQQEDELAALDREVKSLRAEQARLDREIRQAIAALPAS